MTDLLHRARVYLTIGLLAGWSWTDWHRHTGLAPGTIRGIWRGEVTPQGRTVEALGIAASTLSDHYPVAAGLWYGDHDDYNAVDAAARHWARKGE